MLLAPLLHQRPAAVALTRAGHRPSESDARQKILVAGQVLEVGQHLGMGGVLPRPAGDALAADRHPQLARVGDQRPVARRARAVLVISPGASDAVASLEHLEGDARAAQRRRCQEPRAARSDDCNGKIRGAEAHPARLSAGKTEVNPP